MTTPLTPIYDMAMTIHGILDSKGIPNIDHPHRDAIYKISDKAETAWNKNNFKGIVKQKNKMEKLLSEVQK